MERIRLEIEDSRNAGTGRGEPKDQFRQRGESPGGIRRGYVHKGESCAGQRETL